MEPVVFFTVCAVPVVALFGLLYFVLRPKDRRFADAEARESLEARLVRLERENLALLHRMAAVERRLAESGPTLAPAGMEAPTPEAPRLEAPIQVAPSVEAPSVEAPNVEAPSVEAPNAEAPSVEAPNAVPAIPDPPISDAPPTYAPPPPSFNLEQWIGVKGAAAAGALLLMLAGVYFFQYSIEHDLIPPWARVAIGTLVGLGCILFSELRLRTRHVPLANFLAGAGAGILYLASWAGIALYHLYGAAFAFVLMVSVTATTCALALRRDSLAIAVLGMLGGFATPILLSTGSDRPIALFAYLLLLNGALLFVARRRGWPILGLLSLVGTALYQVGWIGQRMDAARSPIGVTVLGLFTLLFTLLSRPRAAETDEAKAILFARTRVVAVVLPFLLGLFFTLRSDLGPDLYPTSLLLLVLTGTAAWVARTSGPRLLPTVTSGITLAVVAGYLAHQDLATTSVTLQGLLTLAGLAGVLAAFAGWDHFRPGPTHRGEGAPPALAYGSDVLAIGGLLLLAVVVAESRRIAGGATLAGAFALATPLLFTARLPARGRTHVLAAIGLGLAFVQVGGFHFADVGFMPQSVFLALSVAAAVFLAVPAMLGAPEARRWADHGAALGAVLLLPFPAIARGYVPIPLPLYFGTLAALTALGAMATARLGRGGYLVALVVVELVTHVAFVDSMGGAPTHHVAMLLGFGSLGLAGALFPTYLGEAARRSPSTWRAAALAPVSIFPAVLEVFSDRFDGDAVGAVPVALAAVACMTTSLVRMLPAEAIALRKTAFVWPAVVALGFVTAAIPLQLENEWVTIGWALQGALALALWRRVDHAGLKYYAGALLTVVTIRLTLNPEVLGYHPASGFPVVNWLAYTYLVPAAALLAGAWALHPLEVARYRTLERSNLPANAPFLASVLVVFAVAVGFAWINLTIADAFAEGRAIEVWVDRRPARDLTQSLAWALYACLLLFAGMWRESKGLRGLSLGLMIATCAKVFLYDLGNLEDLYRVAALVGLSLSLIVISLTYQRFVFGGRGRENAPAPTPDRPEES